MASIYTREREKGLIEQVNEACLVNFGSPFLEYPGENQR
jgi:hypothetical protein